MILFFHRRSISLYCAVSRFGLIYNGFGVFEWIIQLGNPLVHIFAIRVKFFQLNGWVEYYIHAS